jgi:hypothetical protein
MIEKPGCGNEVAFFSNATQEALESNRIKMPGCWGMGEAVQHKDPRHTPRKLTAKAV